MTCAEFEDLILDEIDGRIGPDRAAELRDHLAACEPCRSFRAAHLDLDLSLVQARMPELPPRFSSRVLARLSPPHPDWPRLGFLWEFAGVSSVAAAAGFGAAYFSPHILAGAPWIAAGAVLCGGAWLTLADPPSPHA